MNGLIRHGRGPMGGVVVPGQPIRFMRGSGQPGPDADPFWANVILLAANDNAADGSQVFVNQAIGGSNLTNVGGVQYKDTTAPAGMVSSAFFGGGGSRQLLTGVFAGFGTPDFTIEFHMYSQKVIGTFLAGNRKSTDTNNVWQIQTGAGDGANMTLDANTSVGPIATNSGGLVSPGVWHHIAVTRPAGVWKCFVDGVAKASVSFSNNLDAANPFAFGVDMYTGASADFSYYLSNIRITRGVARYVNTFTPPPIPYANY